MASELPPLAPEIAANGPINVTSTNFQAEVLDASFDKVVVVDFWAEWCGPCKALTPILEKIVAATKGAVKLVKINIDQQKLLAGQFQVKSIPMIYAIVDGKPIDGFAGVQTESQIKAFLDRLIKLKGAGPDAERAEDIAAALVDADTLSETGDMAQATEIYSAILQVAPENIGAIVGFARCKQISGDVVGALALLNQAPEVATKDPAVVSLKTSLGLANDFTALANAHVVAERLNANPKDHEAAFMLAGHAIAAGKIEVAAQYLLGIIRQQRDWQDGSARLLLLRLFEAMGNGSDFTVTHRRQLSVILFS